MNIHKLDWDSFFFGRDVYKIDSENENEILNCLAGIKKKSILYSFSKELKLSNKILNQNNGILVDEKVILKKINIPKINNFDWENFIYLEKKPTNELYDLSFESGKYSRFKIDHRFEPSKFYELYSIWIEESCANKNIKVFVTKDKQIINGFITLEVKGKQGKIGLFAVNQESQRKGIGFKLLRIVENYLVNQDIDEVLVATQNKNIKAMNFYLGQGFEVIDIRKIHHFIKN